MPELPEVDAMVRRMHLTMNGQEVVDVSILRNPGGRYDGANDFAFRVIERVRRRGKVMIFELDNDLIITAHNAMSGFWDTSQKPWTFDYVEGSRKSSESDVRVKLTLEGGDVVRFHDARLFGRIAEGKHSPAMGPDIILTESSYDRKQVMTREAFEKGLKGEKSVKEKLMDQHFVAGIGNIYSVEILWWSHIKPNRSCDSLTAQEKLKLFENSQKIMNIATSFKGPDGLPSIDYSNLFIYRRPHCPACGFVTEKIDIAKRSTYFCSQCQS